VAHGTSPHDALDRRRSQRDFTSRPVPHDCRQRLLWAAQRITGEDGKRTAPSAHALHPLRLRLVAGAVDGLEPGLYGVNDGHPTPELLRAGDCRPALQAAALEDQPWVGRAAALLALCADM
jgi:nitroreductase